MIDPFSEEADPFRQRDQREHVGRRTMLVVLSTIPAALAVAGCVHPAPACPTQPDQPERCQHRFCRHHRG
jgi:hypothetical protein